MPRREKPPPLGPEPLLISRKQVDSLYHLLRAVTQALHSLSIPYILTGGTLLGAVRQHSILFSDDDIDLAILELDDNNQYLQRARDHLQETLGPDFAYTIDAWDGSDRIRWQRASNVFLDLFCIRKYEKHQDLIDVIGVKKNKGPQSGQYVESLLQKIQIAAGAADIVSLFPMWHFDRRKAIELWPKEVYLDYELFPVRSTYKMGPVCGLSGPNTPILLLHRAFGTDCFEVYYVANSHHEPATNKRDHHLESPNGRGLAPLVQAGGTWETGKPQKLQPLHYQPMQPTARAERRHTMHGLEQLQKYLRQQEALEQEWIRRMQETQQTSATNGCSSRPRRTVYMDGVFDLFHTGHLKAIEQCAELGDKVILGVTGDVDAAQYKRPPVLSQEARVVVLRALELVDEVICPCPLVLTEDFMLEHAIDLVVHGFADDQDADKQRVFFEIPEKLGRFRRISYYPDLSTTAIIQKIQQLPQQDGQCQQETKRFGSSLSHATMNAPEIAFDPFPLELRQVIETHIRKATRRQREGMNKARQAYDMSVSAFSDYLYKWTVSECDFDYDTTKHPLIAAFLRCTGLPEGTGLSQLHLLGKHAKCDALRALTNKYKDFQQVFEDFVLSVCAPHMPSCEHLYYQSFPCVRVVQPGEFSIGPHADISYGHHPASANFYIPLTPIDGTASLFLESRMGAEDWHPIQADYGRVKQFAGATHLHWTPENRTALTRVSLDVRLIPGPAVLADALPQGFEDGYYNIAKLHGDGSWRRQDSKSLHEPDARMGFPWTVDWNKVR